MGVANVANLRSQVRKKSSDHQQLLFHFRNWSIGLKRPRVDRHVGYDIFHWGEVLPTIALHQHKPFQELYHCGYQLTLLLGERNPHVLPLGEAVA